MKQTKADEIVEAMEDRVMICSVMDINGQMSKRTFRCFFEEDMKDAIRLTAKEFYKMVKEVDTKFHNGIHTKCNFCVFEIQLKEKLKEWLGEGEVKICPKKKGSQ